MRKPLSILTVLMIGAVSHAGVMWDIYSDETINSGVFLNIDIYDSQDVPLVQTTVDMTGGDISTLVVHDTSVFNLKGGKVNTMFMYDDSTANLTGGTMLMIYPNGHTINVYGTAFATVDLGSSFRVSGTWADGLPFQIQFARAEPTDDNISLHQIPEPASIALLGLGFWVTRRQTTL